MECRELGEGRVQRGSKGFPEHFFLMSLNAPDHLLQRAFSDCIFLVPLSSLSPDDPNHLSALLKERSFQTPALSYSENIKTILQLGLLVSSPMARRAYVDTLLLQLQLQLAGP